MSAGQQRTRCRDDVGSVPFLLGAAVAVPRVFTEPDRAAGLLLLGAWPTWTGWLTVVATGLFVVLYVRLRDLPPFVFYVVLTVVGVGVL